MVRLYLTLDLPTPTLAKEHCALVISDKSEDNITLIASGSTQTTPNPKRVKYEVTGL